MEAHPSYQTPASVSPKYPKSAGCLFQAYNDLLLAQNWTDLVVLDIESISRGVLKGRRPNTEADLHVVPCSLTESLSIDWIKKLFSSLPGVTEIYLGITSDDSSIVYYKISEGIVKPPV